ncbi:MAG: hypothetical protein ACFE7R_06980 [Candidatus Hodarchaeota archaeon]
MMSEPPFWKDPLKKDFSINVISCSHVEGIYEVEIAEHVIRPAGGGQAGDRGILKVNQREIEIIDTAAGENGPILILKEEVPAGKEGVLTIDLEWRRAMMRNHTAEHLFVSILQKQFSDLKLGYIWIDGNHGTVELEGQPLQISDLLDAEAEVQRIVGKKVDVLTELVDASELSTEVRAREGLSEKHETMRIVRIGDFDSSACSGIHVLNTDDIGIFKIKDYKPSSLGVRVEFITGNRARTDLSEIYNQLLLRKHSFPFEMEQIGHVLDKARGSQEERSQMVSTISRLITEGLSQEKLKDVIFIHEILPGVEPKVIRTFIKKLDLQGPSAALFFSPSKKSTLLFWINDLPGDAETYVGSLVEEFGGKGGGSRDVYTGGFTNVESPHELYERLVESLRVKLRS